MEMKNTKKIIAFLLGAMLLLTGCTQKSPYVVKINDQEIKKPEFMLYLYETQKQFENIGGVDIWDTDFEGKTAEEVAKEGALNTIQMVVVSVQKADQYKVSLSKEEQEQAKAEGSAELAAMSQSEKDAIGIDEKTLEKIMKEKMLYVKIHDKVTENYTLSEADFEYYYEQNKEAYKDSYTMFSVQSILVQDKATAQEISAKAKSGEDFQKLFETYETDEQEKEKNGKMEVYKRGLENVFNIKFDMQPGDVTNVLETAEGYFVIKVLDRKEPTAQEITQRIKQDYTDAMRNQLFSEEYQKWLKESNVVKNETLWNEIKLIQ